MTMVRCFLTGLEIPIEKALVLNRRSAVDLLGELKDRTTRLRRVIEQFSPLDDRRDEESPSENRRRRSRRRHRLVSAPAAALLAVSFPEIALFIGWQEYQAKARYIALCARRGCYQSVDAIQRLTDKKMRRLDEIGQRVLKLLDPGKSLPNDTRTMIAMGVCVSCMNRAPKDIVDLIMEDCAGARRRPSTAMLTAADVLKINELVATRRAEAE